MDRLGWSPSLVLSPRILYAQALADSKRGRVERAGVLLGVLSHLETVTGVVVPVPERDYRRLATAIVAERLGEDRAGQLHADGASFHTTDAHVFILDDRANP